METGRLTMVLLAVGIAGVLLTAGSVMLGALTDMSTRREGRN